uniref:Uncharacterized protein n=1 Tax=Arundo donax TaxID=35708 RepID=A0A0A8YIF1_ARUDO
MNDMPKFKHFISSEGKLAYILLFRFHSYEKNRDPKERGVNLGSIYGFNYFR